jgi:hypothetical protein
VFAPDVLLTPVAVACQCVPMCPCASVPRIQTKSCHLNLGNSNSASKFLSRMAGAIPLSPTTLTTRSRHRMPCGR